MNDLVKGFKNLLEQYKGVGGHFLKATAVELFLDYNREEIIQQLGTYLHRLNPAAVPEMINHGVALPIPESFFTQCVPFLDFLEKFPVKRFFEEFLAPANPLITAAIIDMGDEGADYMVKFKDHVVQSVRAQKAKVAPEPLEEHTAGVSPVTRAVEQPPAASATTFRFKVAEANPKPLPEKMMRLTCNQCGHQWSVLESKVPEVKECPECHTSA